MTAKAKSAPSSKLSSSELPPGHDARTPNPMKTLIATTAHDLTTLSAPSLDDTPPISQYPPNADASPLCDTEMNLLLSVIHSADCVGE